MKPYPILLIAIALLGCITSESGGEVTEAGELKVFTNLSEGFSISYPSSWDEDIENQILFEKDGLPALGIKESFVKDREKEIERVKENFTDDNNYTVIKTSIESYNDVSFERLEMWYDDSETKLYAILLITINDKHLYQFLYLGEDEASTQDSVLLTIDTLTFV